MTNHTVEKLHDAQKVAWLALKTHNLKERMSPGLNHLFSSIFSGPSQPRFPHLPKHSHVSLKSRKQEP